MHKAYKVALLLVLIVCFALVVIRDYWEPAPANTITFEGPTADHNETTFVVSDTTADETWTINTANGNNTFSMYGPRTLTFYFGDEQCGQLKCDGQTISFTGDVDKSAEKFVEMVNQLLNVKDSTPAQSHATETSKSPEHTDS